MCNTHVFQIWKKKIFKKLITIQILMYFNGKCIYIDAHFEIIHMEFLKK